MKILSRISDQFRIDVSKDASSESEIKRLLEFSSINVPSDSELLEVSSRHGFIQTFIEDDDYFYFCAEVKK